LVRQKHAIETYAQQHGIRIVKWFTDTISGTTDLEHRPALFDLMKALEANGVKVVLCERLDRLARDLMIQESIIKDIQRKGFELISTAEPDLCGNEPTRTMIRQILGSFAQYERALIVSKLRGARQRAKAKNPDYREGRKPFGMREGESETIQYIQKLRGKGLAWDTIAERLNAEGVKARAGKWHATSVQRVYKRAESGESA
jgi:DNA invertase Pin-like site-specific DNA recombinase